MTSERWATSPAHPDELVDLLASLVSWAMFTVIAMILSFLMFALAHLIGLA